MEDWHKGQLVVCVDAAPCKCDACGGESLGLVEDKIYKVNEVEMVEQPRVGKPYVLLTFGKKAGGYHSRIGGKSIRFRPVRHDSLEGHKEDFVRLWDAFRQKTNVPVKIPVKGIYK